MSKIYYFKFSIIRGYIYKTVLKLKKKRKKKVKEYFVMNVRKETPAKS